MRKIFVSEEHQQSFQSKGYVQVPMLSENQVASLLEKLGELRPDDGFNPKAGGINQSTYHCTFLDTNIEYKRQVYDLLEEYFAPVMHKYLLDYKILSSNFYVKPPGKGEFEIHQNWPTTQDFRETTFTIWCPLVDVNENNGTIELVEGSHKIVPDVAALAVEPFFKDFEKALKEKYMKPMPLKAGQGLIFDDSLLHYSKVNRSDKPRISVQIETLPAESTPVLYFLDPATAEKGFEMFEVEPGFFVNNTVEQLFQRPKNLKSLGFVKNTNRKLTEQEFLEKMRKGDATRRKIYDSAGGIKGGNVFQRLWQTLKPAGN